jgi:mannose-1-phosphate guanylyltransferase
VGELWAIVLAGGDGTRLRRLVELLHDEPIPKQFATITGNASLLQTTLTRIAPLVPPERTVVVVNHEHELLARRQLTPWRGVHVLAQPRNLGTGPGLLLPLAYVHGQAPRAHVAIFPSDHYIPNPAPFLSGVRAAVAGAGVALLGMAADRPETEFGWIVPDREPAGDLHPVARFVEKPAAPIARRLWQKGALWNSFVTVGRVESLWALARVHLPLQTGMFEATFARRGASASSLADLYSQLAPADFSRSVLEHAEGLAVAEIENSGWSDWGSLDRIVQSLEGTAALDELLTRVLAAQRRHADKPPIMAPSKAMRVESPLQSLEDSSAKNLATLGDWALRNAAHTRSDSTAC